MSNRNVLVVDDEIAVLKATAKTIRLAGHSVQMARNADEALALCESQSFDVVVLDFMMPTVDGLELLAKIRRIQPAVQSVIVSGKLTMRDEGHLAEELREQVEADAFLHKPVSARRLLECIGDISGQTNDADWKTLAKQMVSPKKTSLKVARKTATELKKGKRT